MLLNEKEIQTILEFSLEPLFKQYSVRMKESSISIDDKINISAVILYQDYALDLNVSFLLKYENKQICFTQITGKIEYLFLQLPVMNVLSQLIKKENIHITEDSLYYDCDLPIDYFDLKENQLEVELLKKS